MAKSLADMLREKQTADETELRSLLDVEARDFTPENEERANALSTVIEERAAEIGTLDEKAARAKVSNDADVAAGIPENKTERVAKVVREERTYTPQKSDRNEGSFFVDAYRAEQGDYNARARLERHQREMEVEGEGGVQTRATTTGSFAGLVVPQYLVEQAAILQRAGRPVANSATHFQIPDQGLSFLIPRGTTGASAAVQATENTSVSATDQVWGNVTLPVATVAGQQDVSRQSLERGTPGIDSLIYMDLAGAYGVAVDAQVISGSGSAGQVLGIIPTSGINTISAFTAAATATTFYSKVAGLISAVLSTRFLPPTHIAMHPRRFSWLMSLVDSQGRPLVVPSGNGGSFNAMGGGFDGPTYGNTGHTFLGLQVITDANLPTAVGTGPEDQVIVYRQSDLLLWEDGDGMPQQLRFEQTLGNQLTTKLVVFSYIAFTAGRYPTGIGLLGGNAGTIGFGTVAPTF